jgi:tetratricopeptide (TPR) repeat protein
MTNSRLRKWNVVLFLVLLVNSAYIWSFPSPTIYYMGSVVFHLLCGTACFATFVWMLARDRRLRNGIATPAGLFLAAFVLGAWLTRAGNTSDHRWALWSHIAAALFGALALMSYVMRRAGAEGGGWLRFRSAFALLLALVLALPAGAGLYRRAFPPKADRIRNPLAVPVAMEFEGGGPKSPFFPSSARTNVGGIIPSNFFMDSEACGECHRDIYEQWKGSMHHFASFNNQFYRKSIEYMQDVVGTQPTKWCAGCHDHAVFFNGRFERPIKGQIDTPEAHAGLACTSCHAVTHVDSSMGNGGLTVAYPPLHEIANSKNRYLRALNHFLTYLNPEPHRQTFMKPFMRMDTAEYCSACHKVHLDVPVNQYRWFRGFNDYDNWQASGVSGQGARSFYYPANSSSCSDCHMPMVPSHDPGNHGGKIHSHRFPGANTAVPFVNRDQEQLQATEQFLKSGFVTVDIFAVSPIEEAKGATLMVRRLGEGPQAMSGIAAGEETEQSGQGIIREVGKIAAPVDKAGITLRPDSLVRVDVVVRTRKVGHFFPGGTVDAFDVWLELEGKDAGGRVVYWSGQVEDEGRGRVEPGAHFYRSFQLDGEGNPINKRNAWQARSVLYTRMIPPGAADVAHYRIRVLKGARGPITLTARLKYRKFSYYYTQFAYAGVPRPGQPSSLVGPAHNSLEYSFDKANIPANVSGQVRGEIPELPIVTLAQAQTRLEIGGGETHWNSRASSEDRERWNDWGIGLLLQGDLKGAEYAFRRVTEAEPGYADGWLNVARALIQEGETDAAKPFVDRALAIDPRLGRSYFFKAMIQKADGEYDEALKSLGVTASLYPRDRVVLNQIARILFLKREYKQALAVLERVCTVDPEDLQMHYLSILCYRGLGNAPEAAREEALFRRFKAEESSQAITAKRRLVSPEDNNERQAIHDHESVALQSGPSPALTHQPGVLSTSIAGGAQ